ncbi:MAG: antibiotic biosynthesis monooxygenase [Deltaproteobacteria bacterium]
MPLAHALHMILVTMHMKVSPAKRQELSQTIASLLGSIRTEKGCVRCDFFKTTDDDNILCLLQEWETQKDLERHRQSDCFKVLRGAMNLLEEPCEIISCNSLHPSGREELGHPL